MTLAGEGGARADEHLNTHLGRARRSDAADYVARASDGWTMILGGLAVALQRD